MILSISEHSEAVPATVILFDDSRNRSLTFATVLVISGREGAAKGKPGDLPAHHFIDLILREKESIE